jgi:hypothetical protein
MCFILERVPFKKNAESLDHELKMMGKVAEKSIDAGAIAFRSNVFKSFFF